MAEPKVFKIRDKETGKVFTVREKSQDAEVKKESVSDKPSLGSEAAKVAGQFASGLAMDLPNIGNKPIAELVAGYPGSNAEIGMEMGKNLKDRILSGSTAGALSFDVPEQETMNSKFGFPVPPQPETKVGKILGIGANIAGQAITGKVAFNRLRPSSNLKLPKPEQVDQAIRQVDENIGNLVKSNSEAISREAERIKTTKLFRDIKVNDEIGQLELQKRTLADQQAVRVQSRIAVKASQELGKKFGSEYESAMNGKYVTLDDYQEALGNVLKKYGIIDETGAIDPNINLSPSQKKVLNLYNAVLEKRPNDVVQFDVEKMPLAEVDKNLKSVLIRGKQYGSGDHILTDLRYEFSDKVAELRKIGSKFAQDFKDRNAVFDTFKPFGRRGEADVKTAIGVIENLASENPASVYPQNQRMMDFLKKYAGEDPSHPVKEVGKKIVGIKKSTANDDLQAMYSFDEMASRIKASEAQALTRAEQMKAGLGELFERAKIKEASDAAKKSVAKYVGLSAAGAAIGTFGTGLLRKVLPNDSN